MTASPLAPLPDIVPGAKFEHPYPFHRDDFQTMDDEGLTTVRSWRPGIIFDGDHGDHPRAMADGVGAQLLEVISTHKPGKYPARVFYVRRWRDPDGKVFGKRALRVAGIGAFRSLLNGYRYRYEVQQ